MKLNDYIKFLIDNKIDFSYCHVGKAPIDADQIWVYGTEFDIVDFNGKKKKYKPYLRVSHFGEEPGKVYVRDNGICGYQIDDWVYDRIRELVKHV